MNAFIKKYKIQIILVLSSILVSFFFLPGEESLYVRNEFKSIKHTARLVSICLIGLLAFAVFVIIVIRQRSLGSFFKIFPLIACWAIMAFFVLDPFFLSAALFLNKLMTKPMSGKFYTVSLAQKGMLILNDSVTKDPILVESLEEQVRSKNINAGDTLIVSFKKGLLGFVFDPEIDAVKPRKNNSDNTFNE